MEAGPEKGTAVSKTLVFAGNRLSLNVSSRGSVRVGLLDPAGHPIPGLSVDDCERITGDSVDFQVRWKTGAGLKLISGKPVRLKFDMIDAKLYSFQFTEDAGSRR